MKLIEKIAKALQSNDDLYNRVGSGETFLDEAGEEYHSKVGYETIQALKLALEELRKGSN